MFIGMPGIGACRTPFDGLAGRAGFSNAPFSLLFRRLGFGGLLRAQRLGLRVMDERPVVHPCKQFLAGRDSQAEGVMVAVFLYREGSFELTPAR
jgi:hypothetical protein